MWFLWCPASESIHILACVALVHPCQVWRSITSWCSPILWLTRFSRRRCSTCWSSSVKSHLTRPWCSPTSTQGIVWCFHIDPHRHGCCCWSLSPRKVHLSEAFALDHFWISIWYSLDLINGELKMCLLETVFFILLWFAPTGLSTWQTSCPPKAYLLFVSQVRARLEKQLFVCRML